MTKQSKNIAGKPKKATEKKRLGGRTKKAKNAIAVLEKSAKDFETEVLDPKSYAHNSVFRQCDHKMLTEIVRMCHLLYPSNQIAKYIWDNNEDIRERYNEIDNAKKDKDGVPDSLSRAVRRFREKTVSVRVRFPEFPIDVYLSRHINPLLDGLRELQVLIALQKERISDGHGTEKRVGLNNKQVSEDIVILRQLILDFVKTCQYFGVEPWTSYKNFGDTGNYDELRKSDEYVKLSAQLERFGDEDIQKFVLERETKTYSLRRPAPRQADD